MTPEKQQLVVMLMLAAHTASGFSVYPASQLECTCTSTHFVDVSFAIRCSRNSTGRLDKTEEESHTFTVESKVTCSRGDVPPPGPDYRLVRDVGYFKFQPRQATWEDALRTCANEGANLAVVNSNAEAKAMADIFNEFPKLNEKDWLNDQAWIGVTDMKNEGIFLSLTGKTLTQEGWERWETGEPNNEGDGENCAVFNRDQMMTDEPCDSKLSFFCERPFMLEKNVPISQPVQKPVTESNLTVRRRLMPITGGSKSDFLSAELSLG